MKLTALLAALLSCAGAGFAQGPVYISQETPMKIAGASIIHFGGETPSGDIYGAYLVNSQVVFGIYQVGSNHFQNVTADPANSATYPSVSISPLSDSTFAQTLVWIGSNGFQTAAGSGPVGAVTVKRDAQAVAGAGSRTWPVVGCSQTGNRLCAVGWTGVNPPPGLDGFLRGNVNVATNSSGTFAKPPAIGGGIPNAYADGAPVIAFRGNRLLIGYSGTDNSRSFNILWSDDYQNYSKATTGIQGTMASLGVQGTKLVVAWPDGSGALHIGYWNGDPNGPISWQGVITRHTTAGDQAVHGGIPTLASYHGGLILSWSDSANGISTALITLP